MPGPFFYRSLPGKKDITRLSNVINIPENIYDSTYKSPLEGLIKERINILKCLSKYFSGILLLYDLSWNNNEEFNTKCQTEREYYLQSGFKMHNDNLFITFSEE